MEKDKRKRIFRNFTGIVVSDKNDKTIIVEVEQIKKHKKYFKQYKVSNKFKVHDPENKFKVGDKVTITECRPLSKDKRWRVIEGVK